MRINGIEFFEDAPRSPDESYAGDNARAIRSLYFKDGSQQGRFNATRALLGYSRMVTDGDSGKKYMNRQPPHAYGAIKDATLNPDGDPYLYARKIPRGEPLRNPTGVTNDGVSQYQWWRFPQVEYQALPFYVREDSEVIATNGPIQNFPDEGYVLATQGYTKTRFISRVMQPAARAVVLRAGYVFIVDPNTGASGGGLGEGFMVSSFKGSLEYTWHDVPVEAIPWKAIERISGGINSAFFDAFSSSTLLLTSAKIVNRRSWHGSRLVDITYCMSYLPNYSKVKGIPRGHNWTLIKYKGVLDYVRLTDDGTPTGREPFSSWDFADLFRPASA